MVLRLDIRHIHLGIDSKADTADEPIREAGYYLPVVFGAVTGWATGKDMPAQEMLEKFFS